MTEPNDEAVMALWCLLPSEVQDGRELDDIRPWVAAVLDAAGRDVAADPPLYAVVWHSPHEPHPDGRRTRIVDNRADAVEEAAYLTEQCRRMGAGDHRHVAYRLVPLDTPASTP